MSSTLEEHLSYLSDTVRTQRFQAAVAQAIRPGDVVVDVGCGFGILGLMCLEAGAARVWGIDRTDAVEIARESAERAGYGKRYHCLREHSFRAGLPELADVIICDHVGYFGFDYGILETLADARRFLKPGGRVIPAAIDLKLAGVTSDEARARAFAWTAEGMPPTYHWLGDYGTNTKYALTLGPDNVRTSVAALGTIDLARDEPGHARYEAEVVAQADGALDGLAGWFDCAIAGDVRMTNSPIDAGRINRDQAFLPFDKALPVKAGDRIRVDLAFRLDSAMIAWNARNLTSGERRRQTTWRSQILSREDRAPPADRRPRLGPAGRARAAIVGLIDGARSAAEIEEAILRDHPALFPSQEAIRKFVHAELARNAQ